MKNLLLLFILFSAPLLSQQSSFKENKNSSPLYILDGMIANEPQIKKIKSNAISAVSIYKSDNLPENLSAFSNFAMEGIIEIILKEKDRNATSYYLEALNVSNNLSELNPVYVNKILVKKNSVKILENAILDTEIIDFEGKQFLNIWTIPVDERNAVAKRSGRIKSTSKNNP